MNEYLPTALLVEDDHEIRRFVRAELEDEGWQVFETAMLDRAIDTAVTHRPDLIVLELGMPDGDSVDFIASIRAGSTVPIIVLAARVDEAQIARAFETGANDYLSKLFGVGTRFRAALRRLRPPQPDCMENRHE